MTDKQAGSSLAVFLEKDLRGSIAQALPKHLPPDRMARVALTALRVVDGLDRCTRISFAACLLQASQLGLEVNTPLGFAYLIPRKNNKAGGIIECTLQIGYQGFIELARRAGVTISAEVVRAGDVFDYERGLFPTLVHKPSKDVDRSKQPITYAYAVGRERSNGAEPIFEVLDRADIARRKSFAQTPKFWNAHEVAMTRKAAVRALFTWVPKSPEFIVAATAAFVDDTGGRPRLAEINPVLHQNLIGQGEQDYVDEDKPEMPEALNTPRAKALSAVFNEQKSEDEPEEFIDSPDNYPEDEQ